MYICLVVQANTVAAELHRTSMSFEVSKMFERVEYILFYCNIKRPKWQVYHVLRMTGS